MDDEPLVLCEMCGNEADPLGMRPRPIRTARTGHDLIEAAETLAKSYPDHDPQEREGAWEIVNDVAAALEQGTPEDRRWP